MCLSCRCPRGYTGLFMNGTSIYEWQMIAACSNHELSWRRSSSLNQDNSEIPGEYITFDKLPYCGELIHPILI